MFFKQENSTTTTNSILSEFPSPTSILSPSLSTMIVTPTSNFVLTPNTAKSIEQSILASLESNTSSSQLHQIIPSAASGSFVPPLPSMSSSSVSMTTNNNNNQQQQQQPTLILANNWDCQANIKIEENNHHHNNNNNDYSNSNMTTTEDDDDDSFSDDMDDDNFHRNNVAKQQGQKPKKNIKNGGRKNANGGRRRNYGDLEEDERRRVRRERNKLAAARCRKRRVDHTNMLLEETDSLETARASLQTQIQLLTKEKDDLEFLLRAHSCSLGSSTVMATTTTTTVAQQQNNNKPKRPNTLPGVVGGGNSNNNQSLSGISITTPSNGLMNFDNLADWNELPSTGLTPMIVSKEIPTPSLVTPLVTPGTLEKFLGGGSGGSNNNKFVSL